VLCTIAMLTIGSQVMMQSIFSAQDTWTKIINIAGRQRMLSQKIVKEAMSEELQSLEKSYAEWSRAHIGLREADTSLGFTRANPDPVITHFSTIQPHFRAMENGALNILNGDQDANARLIGMKTLAEHEGEYLRLMDEIVHMYEDASHASMDNLKKVEIFLGGVTLFALALGGFVVFEPLVNRVAVSWKQVHDQQHLFELAVKGSSDAIFDWDLKANTLYLAPRFAEMIGCEHSSFVGRPCDLLNRVASAHLGAFTDEYENTVHDSTHSMDIEVMLNHENGTHVWALCRAAEDRDEDGRATRLVGSFADITSLKETQFELERLAERDSLTGLLNRKAFVRALELQISRYKLGKSLAFGIMFLDFDRFKMINDSLGHDVGDGLIKSVAKRMTTSLPEDAIIARFGGDEFAAIMLGSDDKSVQRNCEHVLRELARSHQIGNHEVRSTASIGLVLMETRVQTANQMLCEADIAMYEAKRTGRGKIVSFDKKMQKQSIARQVLESELVQSSVTDQMKLQYQPIHDLNTGELKGFESLVRWHHPDRGRVSPAEFVALSEECGAINHIGRWIFFQAISDARMLRERRADVTVNINVSRVQLLQPAFLEYAGDIARNEPGIVKNIVLEITESAFMDERVDIVPILNELRSFGYVIAIDDFGTGYSSLSCLHRFPVDILKIDRSFVINLELKREFTAVFAAIVTLANAMDLDVVAEGIETKNQLVQLQSMDCGYCQGYYFAPPMFIDESLAYLSEHVERSDDTPDAENRQAA
jgi:diguanylate cyclase (GGDEF)-like protein/PAS domain S-box-containing protein